MSCIWDEHGIILLVLISDSADEVLATQPSFGPSYQNAIFVGKINYYNTQSWYSVLIGYVAKIHVMELMHLRTSFGDIFNMNQ